MKCLLIYPETPDTFWSFSYAVKFISKKSSEIPLGLITVAAMLPDNWEAKLVDTNVSKLEDSHFEWADIIFISGMNIHKKSMQNIVNLCNQKGVPVVAGGPMVTIDHTEISGVSHYVLNEAEITLPRFLKDFNQGKAKKIYNTGKYPDISETPIPRWDLLEMDKYASMNLQYSRGCPHNCEFCSVTMLNGRKPRTKSMEQLISELNSLYDAGWRGNVFMVDDNFIGNRRKLKQETLPALIDWCQEKDYPYNFTTESSINLADDEELMDLMIEAGFYHTFIGIETPNYDSLEECGKFQNMNRDIIDSIKKLQRKGFMVSGGFIVGFDHDSQSIFQEQIDLIQKSGIAIAMVGMLKAPKGTQLYQRLEKENRITDRMTGDNLDGTTNFIPKMGIQTLKKGYTQLLNFIYSKSQYYERVKTFLKEYQVPSIGIRDITKDDIGAFFKSIWKLGIVEQGRRYYWKLILKNLFLYPKKFPMAVTLAIYGLHFRKVTQKL
jgi:radical SAM superfamily enzyme YgiQ (UPF0313 family)